MIRAIVMVGVTSMLAVIWGVPRYLAPDDLANCVKPVVGTCAAADAIVVVSGGDTNARVAEGVQLYKAGWAPKLIFSGAAADETGLSNALAMKKFAISIGASESIISTDEYAKTTAENARNTSRMIDQAGIKRVILVTSAYHERRASLEFARYLDPNVTLVRHPVSEDRQWSSLWWATPTGWWLAGGEIVKIISFYVMPGVGL